MNLPEAMIRSYLDYITSLTFIDPDDVTEDMSAYDDAIDAMGGNARYDDNLEYLRLAMDSLIADPDGRLEPFYGSGHPFTDRELHQILRYAYRRIWPDQIMSTPGTAAPVAFLDVTEEEWKAMQQS